MKTAVPFVVLFFAALAVARPGDDYYTDKYDNINLDEILSNRRLLEPYVDCLLEKGRCTAAAKELRDHISEALENNCAKCSEKHKKGTRRVIGHLIRNEEGFWKELRAKYDPGNKFANKYEKELREFEG